MSSELLLVLVATTLLYYLVIEPLYISSLAKIPGPKLYALTKWRLALDEWSGQRSRSIDQLHRQYGPVVRVGPCEIHFNSLNALRTIYGAGSGFERTPFYSMFDVYGKQNLFTFHRSKQHADRKKLLANAYSKSSMMNTKNASLIQDKVKQYLGFLDARKGLPDEIFTSLHYFSVDTITHFVYGPQFGGTSAMQGEVAHQALLGDILHPARRRLSWFMVHLTSLTKWMYTRVGWVEKLLQPVLPMPKPATYTGIRQHALKAWQSFKSAAVVGHNGPQQGSTIASLLFKHHVSQSGGQLEDLAIASECADHLLAGIDTTADTLMFLVWALSLPMNRQYQQKLVEEMSSLPDDVFDESGVPLVDVADRLVYLNAVIKETLRLYAPLPATEPRRLHSDSMIDGYAIPAGTIVGMAPFSLHRNEKVFSQPLRFDPERWLAPDANVVEMNKWFWAFSSGARMCIGMHIAMAEMTTLVAALYRKYSTSIASEFEGFTPAITSRFELFFDETSHKLKEHECWINFVEHDARR